MLSDTLPDKRQQLISTAFSLFYQHGIHAVGINQILKASGIAKKTLYHHFRSKEELLLAVLEYRDQIFLDWLAGCMNRQEKGQPALEAIFDALDDWFNNRTDQLMDFYGCFFINTCAEFGDVRHQAHQRCARHKEAVERLVLEQVKALCIDQDPQWLTQTICQLKEGAIVQAHIQGDRTSALRGKQILRQLLNQPSSPTI